MKNKSLYLAAKSVKNSYHTIGLLEKRAEGYVFRYTKGIEDLLKLNNGDNPADVQFRKINMAYLSAEPFPFFADMAMSRKRPDYREYIKEHGLEGDPDILDILSRTLGYQFDSGYEVFPKIDKQRDGSVMCDFVLCFHNVKMGEIADVKSLKVGEEITFEKEKKNPSTKNIAFRALSSKGKFIGYFPRYIAEEIIKQIGDQSKASFTIKKVNGSKEQPKIIVRMNAQMGEHEIMADEEYIPLVKAPDPEEKTMFISPEGGYRIMGKVRLHGRTVPASRLSAQAKAGIEKADRAKNSSKKAAYSGKNPRRNPVSA